MILSGLKSGLENKKFIAITGYNQYIESYENKLIIL